MELSFTTAIILTVLAILSIAVFVFSLKHDETFLFVISIILVLFFGTDAIVTFVPVCQNRSAVSKGTDTYKVTYGGEVHIEDLYVVRGHYYYDTNYELRYNASDYHLLIYKDGENIGFSNSHTIIKLEETQD